MFTRTLFVVSLAVLVTTLGTSGCSKGSNESTTAKISATATSPPITAASPALPTEVAAMLAKADALDGTTDHVVSKCGMCALRMPGSDTYTTALGEYALHFCSDDCKKSFDEDATEAVLAFNVGG